MTKTDTNTADHFLLTVSENWDMRPYQVLGWAFDGRVVVAAVDNSEDLICSDEDVYEYEDCWLTEQCPAALTVEAGDQVAWVVLGADDVAQGE